MVRDHAAELSAIDGAIGDGDHGVNMSKGFGLAAERLGSRQVSVSEALGTIGHTLLADVGGAMGPLYGTFFLEMAAASADAERIDATTLERMLDAGVEAVLDLGGARVGDKTLIDVMVPARDAFHDALAAGGSFEFALDAMSQAADKGKESTRDLVARVGRASRLGERSRGVLDAGATSCALILAALAGALRTLLSGEAIPATSHRRASGAGSNQHRGPRPQFSCRVLPQASDRGAQTTSEEDLHGPGLLRSPDQLNFEPGLGEQPDS
ncbi:MAG: dihydroxyacetone kinase subunit DhaL [Candidatus Limnocylindrales bacterium]